MAIFFALRRGIDVNFCADLNGSGTQGIFIRKKVLTRMSQVLLK